MVYPLTQPESFGRTLLETLSMGALIDLVGNFIGIQVSAAIGNIYTLVDMLLNTVEPYEQGVFE